MRIIIELDSNTQPDIKTSSSAYNEQTGNYSSSSASALDAGYAKIPEPEIINVTENEMSMPDMDTGTQGNDSRGIDAGSFNGTQSDSDGNTIMSSHQNDLAIAVSSGSALDAGGPKLAGDESGDTLASQQTGLNIFDRSNAISAGEFVNDETAEVN